MSHTPLCHYDLKEILIQSKATVSESFLYFTCFSFLNRLNLTETSSEHLDAHQGCLADSRLSDTHHLQMENFE